MPNMSKFTTAERTAEEVEKNRALFKGARYGELSLLKLEHREKFEEAMLAESEEAIHQSLWESPYLLQYLVRTSGHHGIWAYSKQMIKTRGSDSTPGLIPDFLVATRNSLGFQWHIIELKRSSVQFGNPSGKGYSSEGHKAISQCASYVAHFNDYIETIRSNIRVKELIQPSTVILVIGDSTKETDLQRERRQQFEGIANKVEVVTYDRIVRGASHDRQ